jgi:hypothetical protein
MTLKEIRTILAELTGRYDLVVDTTNYVSQTPLGMNFFINAALKFLDDAAERVDSVKTRQVAITQGTYQILVDGLSALHEVWTEGPEQDSRFTIKQAGKWILDYYGKPPFTQAESGRPEYYAMVPSVHPTITNDSGKRRIFLLPPADQAYTVFLEGRFYTPEVSGDTDRNYWSEVYPHTLVRATMLQIESFYRNREGVNDQLELLRTEIRGLDLNLVEEQSRGIHYIKNSW